MPNRHTFADGADSVMQVFRSGLGIHAAVYEAHESRKVVVAKKSNHLAAADTHSQRRIKLLCVRRHTGAVAPNSHAKRVTQNSFVGGKPFESTVGRDRQSLLADRALRGP